MLLSPVLAASLGLLIYKFIHARKRQSDCACVVAEAHPGIPQAAGLTLSATTALPVILIAEDKQCDQVKPLARISINRFFQKIHIVSAVTICFARALNDTPKLAALLFAVQFTNSKLPIVLIGMLMAMGGVLFAQKVATTMSKKVTCLDDTQGLTANLITTVLVLMASKFGLPVSTTHVSVGAIAGVGASAGTLNWQALRGILLSWVATLPLALAVAWAVSQLL